MSETLMTEFMTAFLTDEDREKAVELGEEYNKAVSAGNKKVAKGIRKEIREYQDKQLSDVQALIDADLVKNGGTGTLEAWFESVINLDLDSPQYLSVMTDDVAIRELQQTEFLREKDEYARAWYFSQYGPATAGEGQQELYKNRAVDALRGELVSIGVDPNTVSQEDYDSWVNEYYINGWNDARNRDNLRAAVVTRYMDEGAASAIENIGDKLRNSALDNGVRKDAAWFLDAEKKIMAGEANFNTYDEQFRQEAISRYPLFTDRINAGESLWSVVSPWKTALQETLEYSPQDIFDPNLQFALEGSMGDDGKPSAMSIYDYKKYLRNLPQWEETQNGKETIDGNLIMLAEMFGVA
jgi:hypothetical protein